MTITKDRNGNVLEKFDVCRNIYQEGDIQFYYYIGTDNMAESRGKKVAIFSNVKYDNQLGAFERLNGKVVAMEKVSELSSITAEAQRRVKEEMVKIENK